MAVIDVAKLPTLTMLYFDRVEGTVGGWSCKHCKRTFPDSIPFGPPFTHECAAFACSWCGDKGNVSHGICPTHFVEMSDSLRTTP